MRRISVYDCASLFSATEAIGKRFDQQRAPLDYGVLRRCISDIRAQPQDGWLPAEMDLALVSTDPKSESSGRFQTALERHGYTIDPIDYHSAFVSLPPGRVLGEDGGKSIISVAARITYLAGLLARWQDSQLLVVSHAFEIYEPLQDLARRTTKGRAGIAYFSSLIDFRYRATGLLDPGASPKACRFYDLDEKLPELFGGTSSSTTERHIGREVLAQIGT